MLVVDIAGFEIGQADFLGRPAGCCRHHLHQAGGAHGRARIHDEAAFLANQTIDIGRVKLDCSSALDHRIVERHRVALAETHELFGALAGIDAAVPDLELTGQISRSQQIAVRHATVVVQIGRVIPLPDPFTAQTQIDRVNAAQQTWVGACPGLFIGIERLRLGCQRHFAAQLVFGQLLIKTD